MTRLKLSFLTLLALTALLVAGACQPARADYVTPDPSLPVLANYDSATSNPIVYNYGGVIVMLRNICHTNFTSITRTPSGPNEIETFNSTVFGQFSINSSPFQPFTLTGSVQTIVFNRAGGVPVTGTFATEMLQMTLTGNVGGFNVTIRESPTLASTGQTTITPVPGPAFRISSFFDVFTELDINGGGFVAASSGAHRVELNPEPSSIVLIGIGAVGLIGYRWRRRRQAAT